MKKLLLGVAAISAFAIITPASAQSGNRNYGNDSYGANANIGVTTQIQRLQARLDLGVREGTITRQAALPIRQQLRLLTRTEVLYSRDGIDGRERADLQQRVRTVRQQLRVADRNNNARYDNDDNYAQNDRYDRDGRYDDDRYGDDRNGDDRIDSNRDGWDDRDYNRDGRWDDDRNNGTYGGTQQGGLGGILGNIFGGGGLRVGQRVTGEMGAVPSEYRRQYRDGDGVYYRSDDRSIYQIDARNDTVLRVYAINR